MKKILITGGAGYIGSVLVEKLLKQGHFVRVLDNFLYTNASLFPCFRSQNFEAINGNACDEATVRECLKNIDFIFPLACLTGAPLCDRDPFTAEQVNFKAIQLINVLRSKDQKIIYPNTNSGYGRSDTVGMVNEDSPLNPVSLYGKLKNQSEQYLLEQGNAVTFRLATVFGVSSRMRTDLMVNDFVFQACHTKSISLFESHFRRNFLYIGDAADGFIYAMENFDRMKDNAYNLGLSEANLTKRELCEVIKKHIPELEINEAKFNSDPDQRDYLVDNSKIELAGFKASTNLDQGIMELIKLYKVINLHQYGNV